MYQNDEQCCLWSDMENLHLLGRSFTNMDHLQPALVQGSGGARFCRKAWAYTRIFWQKSKPTIIRLRANKYLTEALDTGSDPASFVTAKNGHILWFTKYQKIDEKTDQRCSFHAQKPLKKSQVLGIPLQPVFLELYATWRVGSDPVVAISYSCNSR